MTTAGTDQNSRDRVVMDPVAPDDVVGLVRVAAAVAPAVSEAVPYFIVFEKIVTGLLLVAAVIFLASVIGGIFR